MAVRQTFHSFYIAAVARVSSLWNSMSPIVPALGPDEREIGGSLGDLADIDRPC